MKLKDNAYELIRDYTTDKDFIEFIMKYQGKEVEVEKLDNGYISITGYNGDYAEITDDYNIFEDEDLEDEETENIELETVKNYNWLFTTVIVIIIAVGMILWGLIGHIDKYDILYMKLKYYDKQNYETNLDKSSTLIDLEKAKEVVQKLEKQVKSYDESIALNEIEKENLISNNK